MKPRIEPYDDETRRRAVERVASGESCRAVSRALGIGHATVARWARMTRTEAKARRKPSKEG